MRVRVMALLAVALAVAGLELPSTEVPVNDFMDPECTGCTADPWEVGTYSRTYHARSRACKLMKVHFTGFSLPTGATVQVCGAAPTQGDRECYKYNVPGQDRTVNPHIGEDGRTSFGAMTVDGQEVNVILRVPGNSVWLEGQHGVVVDFITEVGSANELHDERALPPDRLGSAVLAQTHRVPSYGDVECYRASNPLDYERSMAVGRLFVDLTEVRGKPKSGTCTTSRISPDGLMMTSARCVTQEQLEQAEVHFNYQYNGCGAGSGRAGTVKVRASCRGQMPTGTLSDIQLFHHCNSYIISQWRSTYGHRIGWLSVAPDNAVVGTRVWVPQHPSGLPKKLAFTTDASSFCQVRRFSCVPC
eukprot:TRINITY_DN10810_c0_g1_i3.p1 TRINITY_DN10810_c0_g1~~TRINITY_DN10810_c0_g1_i3.p1  ORF type:complete len:359 (+),score=14.55 TRINITY_DN10810_c0_g1_i3:103-1179(+)